MTQKEKRLYLIKTLLSEMPEYRGTAIPGEEDEQKRLLRSLFNVRPPMAASHEFLAVQDEYLQEENAARGITSLESIKPVCDGLYLWQGDITTLAVDGIVNAANSALLGCFFPCHGCIDNAIHTYAGIQLRLACAEMMQKQGHEEPTGQAKITPAFNLPCRYVLHTVGPIVSSRLSQNDCDALASCYRSCLSLSDEQGLSSIAFCCISTGEFRFPNEKAAEIAVQTVQTYKQETNSEIKVIYNVFKNQDYEIYRKLLGADRQIKK